MSNILVMCNILVMSDILHWYCLQDVAQDVASVRERERERETYSVDSGVVPAVGTT